MDNTRKLLEKLSKGDEKAFDKVFITYFPRLRFFLCGILADENEAENIAQDIFYRLWQNRSKLIEIKNLNAYLFRFAKNAAINHLDRNILHRNFVEKFQENDYSLHIDEADEILIANEMQQSINDTIDNMPPQRQEIFRMSRMEGMSNQEIAQKLSLSKRTVETHISAALADLRKKIPNG